MAQSNEVFISRHGRLQESATTFETKRAEFAGIMDDIKRHMTDLESMWESRAAENFTEQFRRLHDNFAAYENAISEYSRTLREASERYDERENMIANATANLDNSKLFS